LEVILLVETTKVGDIVSNGADFGGAIDLPTIAGLAYPTILQNIAIHAHQQQIYLGHVDVLVDLVCYVDGC